MIVYSSRTEQQMSLRGSDSDRGNLLHVSESDTFMLLRGHLMGIAASHFVLLAMTRVLISVPLNAHLCALTAAWRYAMIFMTISYPISRLPERMASEAE